MRRASACSPSWAQPRRMNPPCFCCMKTSRPRRCGVARFRSQSKCSPTAMDLLSVALRLWSHLLVECESGFGKLMTEIRPDMTCREASTSPQEQRQDDVVIQKLHEKSIRPSHLSSRLLSFFVVFSFHYPLTTSPNCPRRAHLYDLTVLYHDALGSKIINRPKPDVNSQERWALFSALQAFWLHVIARTAALDSDPSCSHRAGIRCHRHDTTPSPAPILLTARAGAIRADSTNRT